MYFHGEPRQPRREGDITTLNARARRSALHIQERSRSRYAFGAGRRKAVVARTPWEMDGGGGLSCVFKQVGGRVLLAQRMVGRR